MAIDRFRLLACAVLAFSGAVQAQPIAQPAAELPALSREWTGVDYEEVVSALAQGQLVLPRFASKDSGDLMRRLVAEENLRFQANDSIPVLIRIQDFLKLQASMGEIAKGYIAEAQNGEDVHAELAAVLSFIVRESASGATLISQWVAVMPRDDTYATRMKGLEMVKSGLTKILLGAETSLGESIYSSADRSLIIDSMADSIEPLKVYLAPDVKAELRRKLVKRRGDGTPEDVLNLDRLIHALDA